MTDPADPALPAIDSALLPAIDDWVQHHGAIAVALRQASERSVGAVRQRLAGLAQWFASPVDRDEVLQTAPALLLGLAYLRGADALAGSSAAAIASPPASGPLDRHRLDDAIRVLADSIAQRPTGNSLRAVLAYPLTLLVCCLIVSAFIATEIVPVYEAMMTEFGLRLPALTRWVFGASAMIRAAFVPLLILLFLASLIYWGLLPIYHRRGRRSGHWQTPLQTRQRWADWAEHVALLLQADLPLAASCQIADRSPAAAGLPNVAAPAVPQQTSADAQAAGKSRLVAEPATWAIHPRVLRPDQYLLASALDMPPGERQNAKLRAIVAAYRDRQRGMTVNLAVWLTPLFTIFIGAVLAAVILGLFMPLVDLITGLT